MLQDAELVVQGGYFLNFFLLVCGAGECQGLQPFALCGGGKFQRF